MNRRTHESPMDFEWQNSAGPVDPTSPFAQITQRSGFRQGFRTPAKPENTSTKNSSFFSSTTAHTAAPFRNPSFTTPRKPFDADLFSETSGAESSPADNADAEDTPEIANKKMTFTTAPPVKKPIFGRYGLSWSPRNTPGRELRRKHDDAFSKKRKRARLDREQQMVHGRRSSYDSEADSGESRPHSREKGHSYPPAKEGWWSSFLSGIESRPDLPYLLSYYPQLLFNYFLVFFVIYLIWCFFSAVRSDVDQASEESARLVLAEMAECANQFFENKCGADQRPPALNALCTGWQNCMDRDPNAVGRARVSAHTFAQIFNSFVEPISWKAMTFTVVVLAVCILVNNVAFSSFRSRANHPPPPSQQYFNGQGQDQFQQWSIPATPRQISNPDFYGQPFHAIMPSQTPGRGSPRKGSRN